MRSGTKLVYQYNAAAGRTSGSQSAVVSFALAAGNTNPQGIADPPAPGSMLPTGRRVASLTDAALAAYVQYQHQSQPDDSKDKKASVISAIDLALLELGV